MKNVPEKIFLVRADVFEPDINPDEDLRPTDDFDEIAGGEGWYWVRNRHTPDDIEYVLQEANNEC